MTQWNMLEKYRQSLPRDYPGYIGHARHFLEFCGGNFSRQAVDRFLQHMKEEGYADGTVDLAFRVLRRLFLVNGLEWPYRRGEGPVIRETEVYAPALDPELVREMIGFAVRGELEPDEAGCLALSTVYGLRRVEMASLRSQDLRLDEGLVFVQTAKHGRQRWHLVPEEIRPYLEGLAPSLPLGTPARVANVWYRIEERTGLSEIREERRQQGEPCDLGFHAIRRTLDRLLLEAGLPIPTVMDFLRWKRSATNMPLRYYSVQFVGRQSSVRLGGEDRRVDEQVFAVHPFLPAWGKQTLAGAGTEDNVCHQMHRSALAPAPRTRTGGKCGAKTKTGK